MCMSDMAVARKMKSLMHWFCGQKNKQVLTSISPSDENSQTVGQCLICPAVIGNLNPHGRERWSPSRLTRHSKEGYNFSVARFFRQFSKRLSVYVPALAKCRKPF